MDPIREEDDQVDFQQALNFELEALKEGIHKRDLKITELEDSFNYERERSDKLAELLKLEETRNEAGEETIQKLKTKLAETDDLMRELRDRFGAKIEEKNEGSSGISAGEKTIKELQNEMARWETRCEDLESQLSKEREALQDEKVQHEQVKFKLAQSEELLRTFRDEAYSSNGEDGTEKFNKIINGLKASIDVQSERNIELNQELLRIRKDAEDGEKLLKSIQEKSEKDQKLIEELNNQNEREYHKNEKLRGDIQRLKRDIDSWKKIQSDMKTQYQDLRAMYDGVCKHADEQKREMLEMKLLMDRDKRSLVRQRDEIDKLKGRVASHKQTYDDLKGKYDENFKLLEEKKYESRALGSQLQTAKKTVSELQTSNKDLKKRSDFSQKELIERHKLLLQTEEKLKDLENTLEEKDAEVEESQKMTKEALEKAEKHSQEAANKEKDLLDRIALIQSLQAQIHSLNEDVKTRQGEEQRLKQVIEEKDKMIERRENDLKDKEGAICEQEQKVVELEKLVEGMEKLQEAYKGELKRIEEDISEKEANMDAFAKEIVEKDNEILEAKRKFEELTNDLKAKQDEFESKKGKEDEEKKELNDKVEDLLQVKESKDAQIQQLTEELEEERKRVHLQNQLLKELELKFEDEDLKMIEYEENLKKKDDEIIELKITCDEKDRVMEELKRELEESAIIQVYLKEIEDLNKSLLDEKTQKDELKQKLENIHLNGSEDISRVEEEKKEVMLQMTKELKRERQTSQAMMNELKEDIRVLECNVENEKERSLSLERELELKDRQLKNERESLLEHVEELQLLLSEEKKEKQEYKDKIDELEKQIRDSKKKLESEIEEYENKHLQILAQKKSSLILDRQEKIEELKTEIGSKKELLYEADRRLIEANKAREVEQIEVKILIEEKDNLIASLKRENSELRKGWEKESQWMEESILREVQAVLVEPKIQEQVSSKPKTDPLQDEARLLEAQGAAIQKLKQKIHSDFKLDKILPQDEHAEETALDALHEENPQHKQPTATKAENLRTLFKKLAIVLVLSPLAYCLSCKFCLTFGAVLVPILFFIYQKPWKNASEQEKMLHDALNGLSLRFAAECSENENLHETIENLKQQSKDGADSRRHDVENNNEYSPMHKKSQSACKCDHHSEEDFAKERKKLIDELERQSKEEHEKQKEELLRIKQKQESDRRRLQRQQALIDKLEVILQEKEIKSRLGQFWGYEELKMAIHRLKHEREVEKNKFEGSSDEGIQKRVAEVIDEAVSREKRRKFEAVVVAVFFSAVLVVLFSMNSSSVFPLASSAIVAACSVFYAIRSWREIDYFKNKIQSEKNLVEAQSAEIKELSVLMDREYDVVSKQKQAIEVLERRLNDEYKKNKDHQLTIARLTWVFQESEEMRNLVHRLKDPNGIDTNPELRKLAEDHARDKFSVFKSMQRQLEEHSSHTEEQRKAIDDLKNATNVIVHAAEKQMSELKSHKENRPKDKATKKVLGWNSLLLALAVVSSSMAFVIGEKTVAAGLPLVFAFIFGVIKIVKGRKKNQHSKNFSEYHEKTKAKPNLQQPFSSIEQYGYDGIYVAVLTVLCYYFKSLPFSVAVATFAVVMVIRLATYVLYRRKIVRNMSSWNDVVEDLWSQIHERTQLIDVQTEEIQTLKQLLEVERSYSLHTERLLKEAKGGSDEGFVDIAEAQKLKKRADELEAEDARLVNYELDEMKIFLEEEKKSNVQLRKTLAEVEDAKRALNTEVTNLKRKLEMEQIRRKELNISKEEEGLLKDRIEELMEDLEAEQKTKQELSAQLIEERSCRELKQIELQDLKEKMRDEQHMNQSLREQVLRLAHNDEEPKELRQELSATQKELEEERLATQRQNLTLMEAIHKVREHNMVLRRQVEDLRGSVKDDVMMQQLKEQSDVQQDEIENLQTLLEEISSTKKALKYQDLIEELQVSFSR